METERTDVKNNSAWLAQSSRSAALGKTGRLSVHIVVCTTTCDPKELSRAPRSSFSLGKAEITCEAFPLSHSPSWTAAFGQQSHVTVVLLQFSTGWNGHSGNIFHNITVHIIHDTRERKRKTKLYVFILHLFFVWVNEEEAPVCDVKQKEGEREDDPGVHVRNARLQNLQHCPL